MIKKKGMRHEELFGEVVKKSGSTTQRPINGRIDNNEISL